jgi:hypothetical protein
MAAAVTTALEGTGVRGVLDPAAAVPPCLLVDYTPDPLRETACGVVYAWRALLRPPRTTGWLAAQWLAEHRQVIRDALDSIGRVTEETGVETIPDSETETPQPAYSYIYESA